MSTTELTGARTTPAAVARSGPRVANVDILRAIAALAVLAIHAYALGGRVAPLRAQHAYDVPLINLASGVWLFFAISGYVISRPFVDRLVAGEPLPATVPYALRRGLRIFPLYWVALTAVIAIDGIADTRGWQLPLHYLLLNNLVPGRQQALFPAAWTLTLEVLFYACVPILAAAARGRGRAVSAERLAALVLASWALSVAFTAFADLQGDGQTGLWLRGLLPAMWQMFCPGILLAVAPHLRPGRWRRWLVELPRTRAAAGAGAAALLAAGALYAEAPLRYGVIAYQLLFDFSRPLFAIGYGLLIAAAVRSPPWGERARWMLGLGGASYGIYLIHPVIAEALLRYGDVPEHRNTVAAFVLNTACLAALTIPLALASWSWFEQPAIALGRRLGALWQERGAAAALRSLRFAHAVVALTALALLARVVVVLTSLGYVPHTDAADYDRIAAALAQHGSFPSSVLAPAGGPTALRPPLFPLALAAVYKLVGVGSAATRWEAGRLFEAVLGAVTVTLVCLIAQRLWGRRAAVVSGALGVFYPPLILVGSSLMTESLFIPLVLGAVLCALLARDSAGPQRRWWELSCGLLVGLETLTRANGIVLLIPVALLVWRRPRLRWRALRGPAAVLAATAATLVPWTVRNLAEFHRLVPVSTEAGYALAGTYNAYAQARTDYPALWLPPVPQVKRALAEDPKLNEAALSDRVGRDGLSYAEAHPGDVGKVIYWNALRMLDLTGTRVERYEARYVSYPLWLASLSVYWFWAVGLAALASALARRAARRVPWAFWACPAVLVLSGLPFIGAARYRSPADPFLLMLAALAVLAASRRFARPGSVPSAAA